MVITSSKILSNHTQDILNVARSEENKTGNKIRVIIASGAGGEGIDLKYIRQMHIMEPHFHFSMIEQAVGRAIRNKSHTELPIEKRNCTVFYHGTQYPDNAKETVDMHIYRMAIHKKDTTNNVRKIIQEHSVTCEFFKGANVFDYSNYLGTHIIDSKGVRLLFTESMVNDEGYTNKCASCQYSSYPEDTNTYDPILHSKWEVYDCISKIQGMFKVHDSYKLNDIMNKCRYNNNKIDKETIYIALDLLLNSNKSFVNQFDISGTLDYHNEKFIFTPTHKEYSGIVSGFPLQFANTSVNLSDINWPSRPVPVDGLEEIGDYDLFKDSILFNDSFWTAIPETKRLLAEIVVDRLSSQNRIQLYKSNITDSHIKSALERYNMNGGTLDIERIKSPQVVNIVDLSKKDHPIITPLTIKKVAKVSPRKIMGYTDINSKKGYFYIRDQRKSEKPQGQKLLPQNKSKIMEIINYIIQEPMKGVSLMNKDRYIFRTKEQQKNKVFPDLQKGQYHKDPPKFNEQGFDTSFVLLELEMLLRLLDLRHTSSPRWFLQSWEVYEFGNSYGIKSKDDDIEGEKEKKEKFAKTKAKMNAKTKGKKVLKA
jgi:hypothetical protein